MTVARPSFIYDFSAWLSKNSVDVRLIFMMGNAIVDTIRQSDMCVMPTCATCGLSPSVGKECGVCGSKNITKLEAPYSLKVFSDLSKCANMLVNVRIEEDEW
jgi:hypothetical protein